MLTDEPDDLLVGLVELQPLGGGRRRRGGGPDWRRGRSPPAGLVPAVHLGQAVAVHLGLDARLSRLAVGLRLRLLWLRRLESAPLVGRRAALLQVGRGSPAVRGGEVGGGGQRARGGRATPGAGAPRALTPIARRHGPAEKGAFPTRVVVVVAAASIPML